MKNSVINENAKIKLRRAALTDAKALFEWRNSPAIRKSSFSQEEIRWEDHIAWFEEALISEHKIIFIAEIDHAPIGVLRYDLLRTQATVNIYLVPGLTNRGLGTALLKVGNAWVSQNLPTITEVVAQILPDNIASQKAFKKAGFLEDHRVFKYPMNKN